MTQEQYRRTLAAIAHSMDLLIEERLSLRDYVRESLADTKHWVNLIASNSDQRCALMSYRARLIRWFHGSRIGNPPSL
jgi:hypothetical protein